MVSQRSQPYHCLLPPQRILRLSLTPASTHSHPIPHQSINSSPKTRSRAQVRRVHHPSPTALHPLPVGARAVITYAAYSPWVDVDGKSNSPIHYLDHLILVNRYAYPFNKMTYSDVDVLPQPLLLYSVGTHRVPEHSDLILRSHSASSIEEFLSPSHSPPLGASPHRSSSPFATSSGVWTCAGDGFG